jgi:hypothetical protein
MSALTATKKFVNAASVWLASEGSKFCKVREEGRERRGERWRV